MANSVNLIVVPSALPDFQDYRSHFLAQAEAAMLQLGLNIQSDLERTAELALALGQQTKILAQDIWSSTKAPYIAARDVIVPAVREQGKQLAWASGNAKSGWKNFALFYKSDFGNLANLQKQSLAEQKNQASQLASNVWDGIIWDAGLLDKYARNDFDIPLNLTRISYADHNADILRNKSLAIHQVTEDRTKRTHNAGQILGTKIVLAPTNIKPAKSNTKPAVQTAPFGAGHRD